MQQQLGIWSGLTLVQEPHCVCPLCRPPYQSGSPLPQLTCPVCGNLKPVPNCCIASPARCPNCSEDHSAGYRHCTTCLVALPRYALSAPETEGVASATPSAHLSLPFDSRCPQIGIPWTWNRTRQEPQLATPYPPPQALCPP